MEVKEAIECLEVASEFQVSINRQEEIKGSYPCSNHWKPKIRFIETNKVAGLKK